MSNSNEELKKVKKIEEYEAVRAGTSISSLLGRIRDIPKEKSTPVEAEVVVFGIPDENGDPGVRFKVKRPSPEEQLLILTKISNIPDDVDAEYNTTQLSAEAKAQFWKCVWQLHLCVITPHITLEEATALMGRSDGMEIVDPLITAINKLSLTKKQLDDVKLFLEDYANFPETLEQLKVAYRNGELRQFLSGEDEVVIGVKETFRTMAAVQKLVNEEDAELYAMKISEKVIDEVGQAMESPGKREARLAAVEEYEKQQREQEKKEEENDGVMMNTLS